MGNNIKFLLFSLFICFSISSQIPNDIPDEMKNKVYCGSFSTTGKMLNGSTAFLDVPYKLQFSDDGFFVESNPGEKFGRDEWGSSQVISSYNIINSYSNQYGNHFSFDVSSKETMWEYKSHYLKSFTVHISNNGKIWFSLVVNVKHYEAGSFNVHVKDICENIFSKKRQIEEDEVTKTKVESYLNSNNLDAAITEFSKMHLVDRALKSRIDNETEKRNLDEDSKRITTIESLLSSNQVDLAVEEFKTLHNSNDNLKQKLQNAINQNYEKQSLIIQTDILNKIISDKNNSFAKFKDGKYSIVLNKEGLVTAESKESNSKSEICSNKTYLKKNGFEYPATYSGEVSISTDKNKVNAGDSIRYLVSEKYKKKDIYISRKGEFYLGRFGAPFTAEMCLKPSFYSEDVIENNINLEQLYTYTRIANGIKIEEGKGYFVEKTIVAKKGTGRKIFRIITCPIWGPFYLYYKASQ
jgi:hypothetical protein